VNNHSAKVLVDPTTHHHGTHLFAVRSCFMVRQVFIALLACPVAVASAKTLSFDADAINNAQFVSKTAGRAVVIKSEVLLDRLGFSPGAIDGREGENFRNAISAFQHRYQLMATGKLDRKTFEMPFI
jgi:hypothetical protein